MTDASAEPADQAAGLAARWRRFYSRLPAAVQLIGLQLWLPVLFIVLFCFCYIAAFHAPEIRGAPVGLSAPQYQQVEGQLSAATQGAVDFQRYDDPGTAIAAVQDGKLVAALVYPDAGGGPVRLYIASAHQFQAAQLITGILTPVFAAQDVDLEKRDVAPLPANDSFGMTALYLLLAWCIGGYMVAMFIGMLGAPLLHRTRVGIVIGGAVVISLLANFLAGPVIGAVDGHFWQLVLIAFGWMVAIGLTVNGLGYFFGRFVALPAILIFVFLSIPASGAVFPVWMLPSVFEMLHPYVVGSGMTEMIKRTLYGVGEQYQVGIRLMVTYAVVGLVLMAIGKPWRERREVRRILAGKTTMFADAQTAARDHGIAEREKVLEKHGVDDDGTAATRMEVEDEQAGDVFINYGRPLSGIDESGDGKHWKS